MGVEVTYSDEYRRAEAESRDRGRRETLERAQQDGTLRQPASTYVEATSGRMRGSLDQTAYLTRDDRRRQSLADAFRERPELEQLEQRLAADPHYQVSPSLRLELGYYREARAAAQAVEKGETR